MKTYLSGPEGNLGTHILKHADFEIVPIGRDDWQKAGGATADAFIHCAYDLKKNIFEAPDEILDSNVISTMKALRFCKANKVPKFLFMSSCSVYGHSSRSSEEIECHPVTINGLTKYLNEKIILEFCEKNGIQPLILRAFNSYGGNDQFSVVSKLFSAVLNNSKFVLYNNGLAERDFIHVEDVAKVVCHFVQNNPKHRVINIGTGKSTRIIDVVEEVQKVSGKKIEIEHRQNDQEVEYSRADTTRLAGELDHKFKKIFDFIRESNLKTNS